MPGSVFPDKTGIEAGLSATGDIFDAIAKRSGHSVAQLSTQAADHLPGQTGLLRLTWDNGDRTVLVNPDLGASRSAGISPTLPPTNSSRPLKAPPCTRASSSNAWNKTGCPSTV